MQNISEKLIFFFQKIKKSEGKNQEKLVQQINYFLNALDNEDQEPSTIEGTEEKEETEKKEGAEKKEKTSQNGSRRKDRGKIEERRPKATRSGSSNELNVHQKKKEKALSSAEMFRGFTGFDDLRAKYSHEDSMDSFDSTSTDSASIEPKNEVVNTKKTKLQQHYSVNVVEDIVVCFFCFFSNDQFFFFLILKL